MVSINIRENEKIIKTFYTHKSSLNSTIFWIVFILSGLFFIRLYFKFDFFGYGNITIGGISIILLTWFLIKFFIWRKNHIIITNERIVYNHQKGIFNKTVTDFLLKDISEVGYEKKGLLSLLSNQGSIFIRTGANKTVVHKILNPHGVVEIINQVRDKAYD